MKTRIKFPFLGTWLILIELGWLNLIDLYKDSYIGTWKIFGFEID